jgi:hypothetical protein
MFVGVVMKNKTEIMERMKLVNIDINYVLSEVNRLKNHLVHMNESITVLEHYLTKDDQDDMDEAERLFP